MRERGAAVVRRKAGMIIIQATCAWQREFPEFATPVSATVQRNGGERDTTHQPTNLDKFFANKNIFMQESIKGFVATQDVLSFMEILTCKTRL